MRNAFLLISIVCGGLFLAGLDAGAVSSAHAACKAVAFNPVLIQRSGSREVIASAKREGCSAEGPLYIQLRHHRAFWFDEALKTVLISRARNNVRYRMIYKCPQVITWKTLFVKAWGRHAEEGESGRPRLWC